MNEYQRKEFERISKLMIEFLCNNGHPHMKVIIDCDRAEIVEGVICFVDKSYIKDVK